MHQITNSILMIRPVQFRGNEQTSINNYYQKTSFGNNSEVNKNAQIEFDNLVDKLRENGIVVFVINDTLKPNTPDSIFPNNWISFHENGSVVTYPMFALNRRFERRNDIIEFLITTGFDISNKIDFSFYEKNNLFLEGTGSMILDKDNKKVYAALSPRTNELLIKKFCDQFNYKPIVFKAFQNVFNERKLIYHTNVMMSVATNYSIICTDCIDNEKQKKIVINELISDEKELILITERQVNKFAGNMLQVKGKNNEPYLVMSSSAFHSLSKQQINQIEKHNPIIHSDLTTIETYGGGSARCMMAEIFSKKS